MSSALETLVDQARAIERPLPVPGVSGLYGVETGGRSHQVTEAQLQAIRARFSAELLSGLNRVQATVDGGTFGHTYDKKLRDDQWIVSRVSEHMPHGKALLAGILLPGVGAGILAADIAKVSSERQFPELEMWVEPSESLDRGRKAIATGHLVDAATELGRAESSAAKAYKALLRYRAGVEEGASSAVDTLEVTRDVSFATVGILAAPAMAGIGLTGVAAAAATAAIGTGVTATGTIAQQAMEVHLDMRKQVDWGGIAFDSVVGLVAGWAGSKLGGLAAKRILASPAGQEAVASVGRRAVAAVVNDLVSGELSTLVTTVARDLFNKVHGEGRPMSPEEFLDQLRDRLLDPKAVFMNLLQGEVSRRLFKSSTEKMQKGGPSKAEKSAPPTLEGEVAPPGQKSEQHKIAPAEGQKLPPAGPEQRPATVTEQAPLTSTTERRFTPVPEPSLISAEPVAAPASEFAPAQAKSASTPIPKSAPTETNRAANAPEISPSGLELGKSVRRYKPGVKDPRKRWSESGLELDTSNRRYTPAAEGPRQPIESGLEVDRSDRSRGVGPDVESIGRLVDFGSAGESMPLEPKRKGSRKQRRNEFGEASQEKGGTEARRGMYFHELNAAEIERGLRIDYDESAGRPRKVTYRVDAEVAGAPGSDPRSYGQDESTSGAQSSDAAYESSGKERGHLAQLEAFKAGSPEAQRAANQFTNLVPMTPELNRGFRDASGKWHDSAWRQSEHRTVNDYARRYGSVTVEVEPIYADKPKRLRDGTPIPTAVRRRVIAPDGTVLEDQTHLNQ
jgi:hypothetical protein